MRPPVGKWWLVMLDVGQGDALAIGHERGWWLVDAGPRTPGMDAGASVVLPFLRWAGVRHLETVALTHDHGDHVGGAQAVIGGLGVGGVSAPPILPGVPGPVARFGGRSFGRGDTLSLAPLAVVRWPPRDTGLANPNLASLVIELGEGAGRALLAADVDSVVESFLGVTPGLSLLKVAHHGAGSSSGARFVAALGIRHAAISCGRHNPFGHPDPSALKRLAVAGARVHRTDRDGTQWFELGSDGARRIDWREGPIPSRPDIAVASGRDSPTRTQAAVGPLAGAAAHW
jgi:competence protein ComEC